ncbi:MAG: energy transducer TonB [Fusobacteriaceae bacterium]
MWFIISIVLHGILLLGGIFHWRSYELTAKEIAVEKINMSFSVNKESKSQKNFFEKLEEKTKNKNKIEKKVEKKFDEKNLKKIKKIEKTERKVEKNKGDEKAEEKIKKEESSSEKSDRPQEIERGQNFSTEGITEVSKDVYVAKNQGIQGLKYEILFQQDPKYPRIAKRLGYRKTVEVKVRFLVGYDGKIEEIKFYGEDSGMGFREEVEKVLRKWKFSPVTLKEKKLKMYFYKAFVFNQI